MPLNNNNSLILKIIILCQVIVIWHLVNNSIETNARITEAAETVSQATTVIENQLNDISEYKQKESSCKYQLNKYIENFGPL